MSLTVRDDGKGLADAASPRERAGSGLNGMSERLSAVGGTLELRPDLRPGFCLIATVPVTPLAPASPAQVTSSSA